MSNRLNKYKYPGAKRLMLEAQELKDNTEDYCAQPLDDNLFEWHFTVRGPPDTAFDGGFYHGRLSFPTEYPMKPPSIILLTPNGRFVTNKKICLSISGYHPETWQPSWSVRTALLALIAFMPTKANRAIGALDFSDAERRRLALKSRTWRCESCGLIKDLLLPASTIAQSDDTSSKDPLITELELESSNNSSKEQSVIIHTSSDNIHDEREDKPASFQIPSLNSGSSGSAFFSSQEAGLSNHPVGRTEVHSNPSSPSNVDTSQGASTVERTTVENVTRAEQVENVRPTSRVVFRSIFVLLFALLMRRIAMIFIL